MAKKVVAKRGCTCCGTGCVLILGAVPLTVVGLWETAGAFIALAVWPAVFASAHLVRYATGRPQRIRV